MVLDVEELAARPAFKSFSFRGLAENKTLLVTKLDRFASCDRYPTMHLSEVELPAQFALQDTLVVNVRHALRFGRAIREGAYELLGRAITPHLFL